MQSFAWNVIYKQHSMAEHVVVFWLGPLTGAVLAALAWRLLGLAGQCTASQQTAESAHFRVITPLSQHTAVSLSCSVSTLLSQQAASPHLPPPCRAPLGLAGTLSRGEGPPAGPPWLVTYSTRHASHADAPSHQRTCASWNRLSSQYSQVAALLRPWGEGPLADCLPCPAPP